MKISYIIPVYNTDVGKLNRCFESIKGSNVGDYEVIIINDGSTNAETVDFCKTYCEENVHQFKLFSYENKGVSAARNRGIKKAEGDYIFFVDSDDQVIPHSIYIDKFFDYDIVLTDIVIDNNYGKKVHGFKKNVDINDYQYLKDILIDNYLWGPYAKFIRRLFLINNNVEFNENLINGEDAIFNLQMISNKPKTIYVPQATYIYWKEDVTSSSRMNNKFSAMVNGYIAMQKAFNDCIKAADYVGAKKEYLLKLSANRFTINILECFMIGNLMHVDNNVCALVLEDLKNLNLGLSKVQKLMICNFNKENVFLTKLYINSLKFFQRLLELGKRI